MLRTTRRIGESSGYWIAGIVALLFSGTVAETALGAPRWVLIYYRQMGNTLNANNRTIENHLFRENGTKGAGVGVTNLSNQYTAIFDTADSNGWRRVDVDLNNCAYDMRIFDSATGAATDQSPNFYYQNPRTDKYYSYILQWLYVSDDARVTAYPAQPVYHYDQVNGLNQMSGMNPDTCTATTFTEPGGVNTDAFSASGSASYQAQTFVVPANVNRIISAQSFLVRADNDPNKDFNYNASIHQGSPTGPQIGPTKTYVRHFSANFKEEAVCWGVDDVPVTPGQPYALKLVPGDGHDTNVWASNFNNYSNGMLYNGAAQVSGRDMIAAVVGIHYDDRPITLVCSPISFDRTIAKGDSLTGNTFTVANGGGGTLNYTVQESVGWLSVNSTGGSSTGEADPITITYTTEGLARGSYTGTITVNAPTASPPFVEVVVNLTVTAGLYAPCDFDKDGDVDQIDFGRFQGCYTGMGVSQLAPACEGARLDPDDDVDADDFGFFRGCMSGPGNAAQPLCAD
jgi:hypothetical protein